MGVALDRRLQITGHKRQPFDLALGRMLRLVGVGVADDDERFLGLGRQGGIRRAYEHPPLFPQVKAALVLLAL